MADKKISAIKTGVQPVAVLPTSFGETIARSLNCTSPCNHFGIGKKLLAPYWEVFIVNLRDESVIAEICEAKHRGVLEVDTFRPCMKGWNKAGSGHRNSARC